MLRSRKYSHCLLFFSLKSHTVYCDNAAFFLLHHRLISELEGSYRLIEISSVFVQVQKAIKKQVRLHVTWIDTVTFGRKCYFFIGFLDWHQ